MTKRRALVAALGAGLASALVPVVALAHATLVSSSPQAGQRLGTAPGTVQLAFSEPVNPRLSSVAVAIPDGRSISGTIDRQGTARIPLATDEAGVYSVRWSTVSAVDGHRLQGQFTFGVGVAAGGGGGIAGTSFGSLALAGARALEYAGLLWAVGGLLLSRLGRRSPGLELDVRLQRPLALALAGGIAVVLGQAALDSPDPLHPDLWAFLAGGSGPFLVGRVVLEGAALAAWARARPLVAPMLAGALVALSAAGHAAAIQPPAFAVLVDAGHLAAAGLWAGSIVALAIAWLEGQRTAVAAMLQRVRPFALGGFGGSVVLGLVRAVQELGGWAGLSTSYGLTLAAKGALVLGTAGVGVAMVRWRRPGAIRIEALVALLVVGAAALLVSYPLPPGPAAQASALTASQVGDAAFPEPGDLTLASNAGQVLVGLSLRPGGPGVNQILLYLQPPEGEAAAARLPVSVRIGGALHAVTSCGPACRRLTGRVQGGEALQVLVGGARGGEAGFTLPALPAPSGAGILLQAEQRMRQLQTYQAQETLGPARPPLAVSYTYQAPDRLSLQTNAGFERVVVGLAGYSKEGANGTWQVQKLTEPIVADSFVWDYAKPSAVRVLGEEVVDGVPSQVVGFFEQSPGFPAWFRLWVGSDDLVRRVEMDGPSHFMVETYGGFDQPVEVRPPTG